MSDKDFLFSRGHLAEVLTVADVHALHALFTGDTEASVSELFAELQMLSPRRLIIYIRLRKSDQYSIVSAWAREKGQLCGTKGTKTFLGASFIFPRALQYDDIMPGLRV